MREAAASPGLTSSDTRKKKKNKSSPTSSAGSLALDTRKEKELKKLLATMSSGSDSIKKQNKKDKTFFLP